MNTIKKYIGLGVVLMACLGMTAFAYSSGEWVAIDNLPSNCIHSTDGCNTCGRQVGGERACTLMACIDKDTSKYQCLAYADGATTGAIVQEGDMTNGAVSPQYAKRCVEGLASLYPYPQGFVGGGSLCYDAAKGQPVCTTGSLAVSTVSGAQEQLSGLVEGWYYPNGALLREMSCPDSMAHGSEGVTPGEDSPKACTKEYMPVCASVEVECIKAPCLPALQTFGNRCVMENNSQATYLYAGECNTEGNQGFLTSRSSYTTIASFLNAAYGVWQFSPFQMVEYTKGLAGKIDTILESSRMLPYKIAKLHHLKRTLLLYMLFLQ